MRIRSSILVGAKLLAIFSIATVATACGGARAGRILADTPALPYQAPDVDEITGIDSEEESSDSEAPAAGPGSAQNPQK